MITKEDVLALQDCLDWALEDAYWHEENGALYEDSDCKTDEDRERVAKEYFARLKSWETAVGHVKEGMK